VAENWDLSRISISDMRRELLREQRARTKIYTRLIREGRLTNHQMVWRNAVITELLALLDKVEQNGGWPQGRVPDDN